MSTTDTDHMLAIIEDRVAKLTPLAQSLDNLYAAADRAGRIAGIVQLKADARRYVRDRDLPRALMLSGETAKRILLEPRHIVLGLIDAQIEQERRNRKAGLTPTRISYGSLALKVARLCERLARRRDHAQAVEFMRAPRAA